MKERILPPPPGTPYRIILASASPRRSQLLAQAGIPFVVRPSHVEEDFPDDMPVRAVAPYLARRKAHSVYAEEKARMAPNDIILAADSTVVLDEVIYNKPADYDEAVAMLRQLSGRCHQVVTGVCLMTQDREHTFSDVADVYFDELSEEDIHYYVSHFEPYDKAGGYAVQEWIGLCRVHRIEGTFSNIMGLPMPSLLQELGRWEL